MVDNTKFSQVNINPAYQPAELKYCLNKVGVRAIVSSESFKTQDYYKMMAEIMPELPSGEISVYCTGCKYFEYMNIL